MVDDYAEVVQLMDKMQAHLPIPAYPTPELARTLRKHGVRVDTHHPLFVKRVFYFGEVGGIGCDATPTREAKEAFVVSLTHLRIAPQHQL